MAPTTISKMREKMKDQLLQRRKESVATNEGGLKFGSIIKPDVNATEWWCKEGPHVIDILPYIAGDGNTERGITKGSVSEHAIYYVHKNVGANDGQFICPSANYNKPCPICEYSKQLKEEGVPDEQWKKLKPKRMVVYNILCLDDDKEEAKGVQIWVIAHWNMERHLNSISKKPRGGGWVNFASPDEGKSIAFERKGSGKDNTQYLGHRFIDRDYTIPDELLESTHCLEEIVHVPSYNELKEAFFGVQTEDEEEIEETVVRPTKLHRRAGSQPVVETEEEELESGDDRPKCFAVRFNQMASCGDCEYAGDCEELSENEETGNTDPESYESDRPVSNKKTAPKGLSVRDKIRRVDE